MRIGPWNVTPSSTSVGLVWCTKVYRIPYTVYWLFLLGSFDTKFGINWCWNSDCLTHHHSVSHLISNKATKGLPGCPVSLINKQHRLVLTECQSSVEVKYGRLYIQSPRFEGFLTTSFAGCDSLCHWCRRGWHCLGGQQNCKGVGTLCPLWV